MKIQAGFSTDAVVSQATGIAERLVDLPPAQLVLAQISVWSGRAGRVQEAALDALNLPSAVGLQRLERRVRSVADRIGQLEDQLDGVSTQLGRTAATPDREAVRELIAEIAELRAQLAEQQEPVAAEA